MRVHLATAAFGAGLVILGCGGLGGPWDMPSWESQVLGTVYGTYCGYYPDRLTQVGINAHLTDTAQCRAIFEPAAVACVQAAKDEGRFSVSNSAQGTALGGQIGGCIDAAYTAALGPPALVQAVAFGPWESQVLGAVEGLYCGYFPDRTTLAGQAMKLGDYTTCKARFAAAVPRCVTEETKAKFVPGDGAAGEALGRTIGGCFDVNMALSSLF